MRCSQTRPVTALLLAMASSGSLVLSAGPSHAQTEPDALDGFSRSAVRTAWNDVAERALAVPTQWSGSLSGCRPGAPSASAQEAVLDVVNLFRDLTDLPRVTFDAELSVEAQQAALMMEARNDLAHYPDASWPCYTEEGAAAAGRSNLGLGYRSGAAAVVHGYMDDSGSDNTEVGHRGWVLDPDQRTMGHGQTDRANALYVVGDRRVHPSPPAWTPWPSAGYLPVQAEPEGRWSLWAADRTTDFSSATVRVTSESGQALELSQYPAPQGLPLVWEVRTGHGATGPDRSYAVTVSGIRRGGEELTHSWTTRLFDARQDGPQVPVPAPVTLVTGGVPSAPEPTALPTTAPRCQYLDGSGIIRDYECPVDAGPVAEPTPAPTPAMTPAPGPGQPQHVPPRISTSPSIIAAGELVTVFHVGTPGATIDVYSRTQPATEFSRIATTTLDASGRGSTTHKPQKNTRMWAKDVTDGNRHVEAGSQPLIAVRSVASLGVRRIVGRTYEFTGRVYPARDQRIVSVYLDGRIRAQGRTDATGVYRIRRTLPAGSYDGYTRSGDDTYNVGATSPRVVLRVS
jgi:uncharacterized protein YkwD